MGDLIFFTIREHAVEGFDPEPHEVFEEKESDDREGKEGAKDDDLEVADLQEIDITDPALALELHLELPGVFGRELGWIFGVELRTVVDEWFVHEYISF